jgi:hypothetical protein
MFGSLPPPKFVSFPLRFLLRRNALSVLAVVAGVYGFTINASIWHALTLARLLANVNHDSCKSSPEKSPTPYCDEFRTCAQGF